jgi:hypothetical protein
VPRCHLLPGADRDAEELVEGAAEWCEPAVFMRGGCHERERVGRHIEQPTEFAQASACLGGRVALDNVGDEGVIPRWSGRTQAAGETVRKCQGRFGVLDQAAPTVPVGDDPAFLAANDTRGSHHDWPWSAHIDAEVASTAGVINGAALGAAGAGTDRSGLAAPVIAGSAANRTCETVICPAIDTNLHSGGIVRP